MKPLKKTLQFFIGLLPVDAPRFIYNVVLKPDILKSATHSVVRRLIDEKLVLPEGILILNTKDPIVSGALTLGCYEKVESKIFREKIKEGMMVIDIGANIGYYSVIASKIVGQKGKVIAFEPDSTNFKFLADTVALNKFTNVSPFEIALSDKKGETKLFVSTENMGDHRMYATDTTRQSIAIKTISLDEHLRLAGIKTVDFIKMDVQGVEWLVLKGMSETISSNQKITILTEFWPYGITASGGDPVEFLDKLKQKKFKIFNIHATDGKLEPVVDHALFAGRLKGKAYANLLCIKE